MFFNDFDTDLVIKSIYSAVITVPGVYGFAEDHNKPNDISENKEYQTLVSSEFGNAIQILEQKDLTTIVLSLSLLQGTNICDILREVQIRVRYEMEKLNVFEQKFLVNVIVNDLVK